MSADTNIHLLGTRIADAEPQFITPHKGNIAYYVHDFTRDSKKLVYSTNEHGEFQQAWTAPTARRRRTDGSLSPAGVHSGP
jgi:hypothetical protein